MSAKRRYFEIGTGRPLEVGQNFMDGWGKVWRVIEIAREANFIKQADIYWNFLYVEDK